MAATSVEAPRGGYRGTTVGTARFTSQLVWLDVPEIKDRVVALAYRYGLTQSRILRAVAADGLGALERGLADGSIDPRALV